MKPKPIGDLYRTHFRESRRERLFLASISFFVTFGLARLIAYAVRTGFGPFRDVIFGGTHIHHLVYGILLLLLVGYAWLAQIGTGTDQASLRVSRLMSILFGVGAALTLDEFALWVNLDDVYWEREGRISVDVALMFGALVSAGLWGQPFFLALSQETTKILRAIFRRPGK